MRERRPANPVPMRKIKEFFTMPVFYDPKKTESPEEKVEDTVEKLITQLKEAGYPEWEIGIIVKSKVFKKSR